MAKARTKREGAGTRAAPAEVDVAVIGGGISGAYASWRLKTARSKSSVALFEYSDRIGGRLYTIQLPGMPHVNAELGGMRYIPKSHLLVASLLRELGIETREFPMGNPDPRVPAAERADNNVMYLRRRFLRVRDLKDPKKVPYLLERTERGKNPDELQAYVMNLLVPNASKLSSDDWNRVKVLDGESLYSIGFWNLLDRVLSSEAFQFMSDGGGYYTNVANSTAVLSLPVDDFAAGVEYRTPVLGYEHLPNRVAEEFERRGGHVARNHELLSIAVEPKKTYLLTFARTETDAAGRTKRSGGEPITVRAKKVILAMPRRSLERIDWPAWSDPQARSDLRAVIKQAAFKIFLGYEYPWWRELGLWYGRSITDMPIRQTYYFQTEGEIGGDPSNTSSLMMVSYNDLGAVPFWKALEEGEPFGGHAPPGMTLAEPVRKHAFAITRGMVEAAQAQVREIHNQKFVPAPYSAIYHDWTEDPFGAGWHAWKAGFEFWKVMPRVRHPLASEDIYICGEAYSTNQGWVEGALQTTEHVLRDHFGLAAPGWLTPADYPLGP